MRLRAWAVQALALPILFSDSFCSGQEQLATIFTNTAHGFTISLPADWGEVPKSELDAVDEQAARTNPKWSRPIFHYGYRRVDTNNPSIRSVILIRVSDLGKSPNPETVKRDILDAGGSVLPAGPSGAARIRQEDVVFDPTLNAFLAAHQIQVSSEASIGTFLAYFLTKQGVLKLICYAPGNSFAIERKTFESVARSVRVSEEFKYRGSPSATPTSSWMTFLVLAALAMWFAKTRPKKDYEAPRA